jgi:LmbE family N-acetylglucosaminyl deacetylase
MEYGTSAAVARWTARGIEVGYLLLTRGEAGMPNPPEETARLRVAEQQAACAVVGVKHLTVLEHPDGVLVYGLDLRRDICREIRRFKPDVVLGTGYEIETPYGFDQADHRAAGLATLDAVRDAGNRWVFPEQVDNENLAPHSVRWLIVAGLAGSGATHGVEVTGEPLRRGIASLDAHAAYLAALPNHPAPKDIIPTVTAMRAKPWASSMQSCSAPTTCTRHRISSPRHVGLTRGTGDAAVRICREWRCRARRSSAPDMPVLVEPFLVIAEVTHQRYSANRKQG